MSLQRRWQQATMTSLLSLAALLPATAAAQTAAGSNSVWRCGDGRYSSVPCPGGVALDTPDTRTAQQRDQSRAAVAADKRQVEQLAAERKARESMNVGSRPVNLSASKPVPAAAASSAAKGKADSGKTNQPKKAKKAKTSDKHPA